MKDYGLKRKKLHENLLYNIARCQSFLMPYFTLNKKERNRRKEYYNYIFAEPFELQHENLAIPDGKYCIPICFITSDLILREDISKLKAGLYKLIKKRLSHKFIGGFTSPDELLSHIDQMDDTLTSWYTFINIGPFDFDGISVLQEKISHFDLKIRNINPSYIAVEACVYITNKYQQELATLIDKDYAPQHGYVTSSFVRNKKSSGGKRSFTISHYNEAYLKSNMIYENIVSLKWEFYQQIHSFFSTLLHQKNICPPSINIYKTDISYHDNHAKPFWESIGVYSQHGQFIDESRKLFFTSTPSGRYGRWSRTDLTYIVNAETISHKEYYYSLDFQIATEVVEMLAPYVFRFALLVSINEFVSKEVVSYKLKLNRIKLRRNCLAKQLKLRYMYERDLDFYIRYVRDNAWEESQQIIAHVFDNKKLEHSYDYRILTETPLLAKDKIIEQIENLQIDFQEKTNVLQHLAEYKNEKKSRYVNYIMLAISIVTLIFIVFPNLSNSLAIWLLNIWKQISTFALPK